MFQPESFLSKCETALPCAVTFLYLNIYHPSPHTTPSVPPNSADVSLLSESRRCRSPSRSLLCGHAQLNTHHTRAQSQKPYTNSATERSAPGLAGQPAVGVQNKDTAAMVRESSPIARKRAAARQSLTPPPPSRKSLTPIPLDGTAGCDIENMFRVSPSFDEIRQTTEGDSTSPLPHVCRHCHTHILAPSRHSHPKSRTCSTFPLPLRLGHRSEGRDEGLTHLANVPSFTPPPTHPCPGQNPLPFAISLHPLFPQPC